MSGRLLSWIKYRRKSKTRFAIHSPFVFDLITGVLRDRSFYPAYRDIEICKKELSADRSLIMRKDHGGGAGSGQELVTIAGLARHHSVSKRYGRLLYRMAAAFKPGIILELGTCLGISTAYMAAACPQGRVITIEGCPETAARAQQTFQRLGLRNVMAVNGIFNDVLPSLLPQLDRLDMVFVDGHHVKDAVLNYFKLITPLCHNDTVLIMDDIHWSQGMEEAWAEVIADERVRVSADLFQFGVLFFKKELSRQHFVLRNA